MQLLWLLCAFAFNRSSFENTFRPWKFFPFPRPLKIRIAQNPQLCKSLQVQPLQKTKKDCPKPMTLRSPQATLSAPVSPPPTRTQWAGYTMVGPGRRLPSGAGLHHVPHRPAGADVRPGDPTWRPHVAIRLRERGHSSGEIARKVGTIQGVSTS